MDKVIAPAKRDTPKSKENTKNEYPNKPKTMDGIPDMECIIICIILSIFYFYYIK